MDLNRYLQMPNCEIPAEIEENLALADNITITPFENKNDILKNSNLHSECGYSKAEDGSFFVSMYAHMPSVTAKMVAWWFWWHPQANKRYQAWFPGEHKSIGYKKRDRHYFEQINVPRFQSNTQYPFERVGNLTVPLSIDFVSAEDFGFDRQTMNENDVEIIVCGHVAAFKGLVPNTEMSHIFFKKEDGLLLVSRFWLGKNLKSELLKKMLVTEKQAYDMAKHCCIEYRNFAERVPLMYVEWQKENGLQI